MSNPINYVCPDCGSDDVAHDAWAEWDQNNQCWTVRCIFDNAYCFRCDGEKRYLDTVKLKIGDAA